MKKYTTIKDLQIINQTVFESSMAGFWDWDMLCNEEYLSPRFKEMFGYQDSEMDNSQEAWQRIIFHEDLPGMFELFQKHIDSKGVIPFEIVLRYHHKSGKTIWVRCNGKVVEWTKDGKPARSIGSHIDITEEKELELKLTKALVERDLLLSEVHHRVKNNLHLILSMARLKQNDKKVALYEIEDSIITIASAYESIYKIGVFDELVISDYLSQVIKPILNGHDIKLNLEVEPISKSLDFLIPIGLIVSECVNNSIKHAFCNHTEKNLNLYIRKEDGFIHLLYIDSGSGYNQEVLNSLDDLDSYGIYIMRSLVAQLNGTINFSNENGAKIEIRFDADFSEN